MVLLCSLESMVKSTQLFFANIAVLLVSYMPLAKDRPPFSFRAVHYLGSRGSVWSPFLKLPLLQELGATATCATHLSTSVSSSLQI